ncbi:MULTISPECIES: recombinase family protein [Halanaerobium]|jgi:DNA invertase Pin-like site-specific DNA recombinase|uniref:DNA invertase Pin-like site-specific DNA recombinase n=1 Tax=Halanaerobium congolense TaxID=54121 RepID=A0A318E1K0_9FIRM|nr:MULTISPECIES: recombinase family protein [Halanaerobium]PUU87611.1 MAG: resolvase domain protein [Halanaerobium sp.]PXV61136.1 DNA invertase Pin-like site-specific DNA recombinase [Halanaerobium congolense]
MSGRKYGYIRVSSKEQNPARQEDALLKAGVEKDYIFMDKMSGKDFDRPEYQLVKRLLKEDDVLFIKDLDRLGRNHRNIKEEWKEITMDIGADIVVLDMDLLDTRKFKDGMEELISNIVLELLSYMAEKEREKINKRQAEGIKKARQNGVHLGRPKIEVDDFEYYYDQVYNQENMTAVEAMDELEVSKSTFYRRKSEYEEN